MSICSKSQNQPIAWTWVHYLELISYIVNLKKMGPSDEQMQNQVRFEELHVH